MLLKALFPYRYFLEQTIEELKTQLAQSQRKYDVLIEKLLPNTVGNTQRDIPINPHHIFQNQNPIKSPIRGWDAYRENLRLNPVTENSPEINEETNGTPS